MWGHTAVLSTVRVKKKQKKKEKKTSCILHEGPGHDRMEGEKQKGKISSKRARERREETDKEGPVRPNKDRLYSSEGQMGVLFMVSPPTRREELPQDPLKPRRCACAYRRFLL